MDLCRISKLAAAHLAACLVKPLHPQTVSSGGRSSFSRFLAHKLYFKRQIISSDTNLKASLQTIKSGTGENNNKTFNNYLQNSVKGLFMSDDEKNIYFMTTLFILLPENSKVQSHLNTLIPQRSLLFLNLHRLTYWIYYGVLYFPGIL